MFLTLTPGFLYAYGSEGLEDEGLINSRSGIQTTNTAPDSLPAIVTSSRESTELLEIRGRIHSQFAYSRGSNSHNEDELQDYSSFELRRVRLGAEGEIIGDFHFLIEANILSQTSLDAAALKYSPLSQINITFGKEKPRFGYEQYTSSAEILTFERSRLDGLLNAGKPLGLRLHGDLNIFSYYLGIINAEAPDTQAMSAAGDHYLYNASGGINLGALTAEHIGIRLRADYINQPEPSGYYSYHNAYAFSAHLRLSGADLRTEYMKGTDHNNSQISGFYAMPSYYLIPERLQAVTRYERIEGDSPLSIGYNRYADHIPDLYSAGDQYQALYFGFNFFIHEHNLKLMIGLEGAENKSNATDIGGRAYTLFSGFRVRI